MKLRVASKVIRNAVGLNRDVRGSTLRKATHRFKRVPPQGCRRRPRYFLASFCAGGLKSGRSVQFVRNVLGTMLSVAIKRNEELAA